MEVSWVNPNHKPQRCVKVKISDKFLKFNKIKKKLHTIFKNFFGMFPGHSPSHDRRFAKFCFAFLTNSSKIKAPNNVGHSDFSITCRDQIKVTAILISVLRLQWVLLLHFAAYVSCYIKFLISVNGKAVNIILVKRKNGFLRL